MADSSPLYRIEVVPLTPLFGKRNPRFSYASTDPVVAGSLVAISFGKQNITGITFDCAPLPGRVPEWMKYVGPTLLPDFLTADQITLAERMSEVLFVQLGLVLKLFLPVEKKPREKKSDLVVDKSTEKRLRSTKKTRVAAKKQEFRSEGITNEQELFERLIKIGRETKGERKTFLILIPEVLAAEVLSAKLSSALPEHRIGTLSSARTPRETYFLYEAIRSGQLDIVVGTRQAVFAPFEYLGHIAVIDPEKRLSYVQWERAPRYDAVEIAAWIALAKHIPCSQLSIAPGLEYYAGKKRAIGKSFRFSEEHDLAIVDMRPGYQSRQRGNHALSFELVQAIRKVSKENGSVLILVKQRGLARFSLCAKCQTVLRCPECETALTEVKSGTYHCLNCRYHAPLFPACANCHEMTFRSFGAGTEAVAREVSREFQGESIVIDRDTQTKEHQFRALTEKLSDPSAPRCIISTYESAESLLLGSFSLIAMVEPDQGLFFPDYQSEERLWRSLHRFGGKLGRGGKLYVQTFEPESKHWTTWVREPLAITAEAFLEERKLLHYPPYYRFIQLECRASEKITSLAVAEKTETAIRLLGLETIEVLPRYLPFSRKNDYHILIRLKAGEEVPDRLRIFLSTLDQSVKITHNPVSLH